MKLEKLIKEIITESDKRNSIKGVFGFNDEWANKFHEINEKLSIWIANSFLIDFIERKMPSLNDAMGKKLVSLGRSKKGVVDFLNEQGTGFIIWRNEYEPEFRHIMDWVTSPRRRGQLNLKTMSFQEALQKSNEWHESLEGKSALNYIEKNEILFDYRNNDGEGYYWVNLKTNFSSEESDRMGHCGRDSGCDTLFSLRSVDEYGENRSHVTASYNQEEKILAQIKGRKNSKPKPVYHKFIMDLLTNTKYPVRSLSKNVYLNESNFKLSDLTESQLEDIFNKNKDLKIYYLFGDKKKINLNKYNPNIVLFKEDGSPAYYGIADIETMEIIKKYEYVILDESPYTEFLSFNTKNGESNVIILKHFKSVKSGDEFILKITNKLFEFISEEEANKIYSTTNWEDLESWYTNKQKKGL